MYLVPSIRIRLYQQNPFPFDLTYMDTLTIRLKPVCLFFELESSLYFIWLLATHSLIRSFVHSFLRTLNKMIVLNFVCSSLESTLNVWISFTHFFFLYYYYSSCASQYPSIASFYVIKQWWNIERKKREFSLFFTLFLISFDNEK